MRAAWVYRRSLGVGQRGLRYCMRNWWSQRPLEMISWFSQRSMGWLKVNWCRLRLQRMQDFHTAWILQNLDIQGNKLEKELSLLEPKETSWNNPTKDSPMETQTNAASAENKENSFAAMTAQQLSTQNVWVTNPKSNVLVASGSATSVRSPNTELHSLKEWHPMRRPYAMSCWSPQ